jgi:hypothetical protein
MAGEDEAYLARVRALPCRVIDLHTATPCRGGIEAHHAGARPGIALKSHDHTTLPLCAQHHRDLHALAGPFRGWRKAELRSWAEMEIAMVQGRLMPDFDAEQDRRDEAAETWKARP